VPHPRAHPSCHQLPPARTRVTSHRLHLPVNTGADATRGTHPTRAAGRDMGAPPAPGG
jgi:hypothetical protein